MTFLETFNEFEISTTLTALFQKNVFSTPTSTESDHYISRYSCSHPLTPSQQDLLTTMSHAHDASKWDSHASTWSTKIQAVTLSPCTSLVAAVEQRLAFTIPGARVLDNGAGAGMMTSILKKRCPTIEVLATDLSSGMLETMRRTGEEQGWLDETVETRVLNAEDLTGIEDACISHALSTFVLSFTSDPTKACREMRRVTRPGGLIGLSTWSRVSWIPVWERAVRAAGKPDFKAPTLFQPDTMEVEGVRKMLTEAGWKDVEVWTFECAHPEQTAEQAADTFYTMANPSTKLLMGGMSEEFLEETKASFLEAFRDIWGGAKKQFELAILAVGTK